MCEILRMKSIEYNLSGRIWNDFELKFTSTKRGNQKRKEKFKKKRVIVAAKVQDLFKNL